MRPSVLALGVAGLLLAGCGGTDSAAVGGAADVAPAEVAGYVSLNTDRESDQVERLRELVESFPGARGAIDELLREALDGKSWEDVEPAIGDEVALVLLAGADEPVLLTQPDDVTRLEALAAEAHVELEVRAVEDWHAVGAPAALDAFVEAREGGSLAGDDDFRAAFDDLPGDAIARFYGAGGALNELLPPLPGAPRPQSAGFGVVAGVIEALEDGLRVDGRLVDLEVEARDYEPQLLDRVPDDAFLVASFADVDAGVAELRKQGLPFLPSVERALGVTLDDLGRVFAGESVLYARSGIGIPEVTLATRPDDPDAALATLLQLARTAAGFADAQLRTVQLDGLDVHVLDAGVVRVQLARVDDEVVLTTGAAGLRDYRRDGDKLTGNERFEDAVKEAGLLYVDLQAALPIAEALAGFASEEIPTDVRAALERLDWLATQARVEDGAVRMTGVLRTR